jgi:hypothetical protein
MVRRKSTDESLRLSNFIVDDVVIGTTTHVFGAVK